TNRQIPAFVIGPPPRPGVEDSALAGLSEAFADVCGRRRIPYVETFAPLRTHEQWLSDVAAGDGLHPGQAGYGLLAWLVLHNGWHAWLGLPDEASAARSIARIPPGPQARSSTTFPNAAPEARRSN